MGSAGNCVFAKARKILQPLQSAGNYVIGKQREFSNWWEAQETMQVVPSGKHKAIVLELEEIQPF